MKKIHFTPFLAFLLWFVHLVNLYIWLKLDVNYCTYDAHRHFLLSLKVFEEYQRFSPDIFSRCCALTQRHPPLVMMVTAPFYFIFGKNQDAGILINAAIFSGILIFAVYKIGKIILNSKAGLFAAFILTMYPVVFNQLKVYMLDLPLTAIVSLSIYFLILSDKFNNFKYSLLLLISLILGVLVKASFVIFLAVPLIYVFIKRVSSHSLPSNVLLYRARQEKLGPVILFFVLIAFGVLIILCCAYYFSPDVFIANIGRGTLIEKFIIFSKMFGHGPGYLRTWSTVAPQGNLLRIIHAAAWYFWGFINWQVSFLFFVVFLIGACFFIRHKLLYKDVIFYWVIGSFFLLINLVYGVGINMEVSAVRYSMPLLPSVAIMSAVGVIKIPVKRLRNFLIMVVVILGITQFIFISYSLPLGNKFRKIEVLFKPNNKINFLPESIIIFNFGGWTVSGSDSGSHPVNFKKEILICEQILNIIGSSCSGRKEINVAIIPDDTRLWYLQYLVFVQNKPYNIFCDWNYLKLNISDREAEYSAFILDADYVIDKYGGWQGEEYMLYNVTLVRNYFNLHRDKFFLLKELKWPDGSTVFIYKKAVK